MAEPIRVAVRRGEIVESVHRVHAVAVRDGEIVAAAGDPDLVTFMRSSAKPIQALPLARAREDLDDARPRDRVARRTSPTTDAARRPSARSSRRRPRTRGRPRVRRRTAGRRSSSSHNCSGKHAGMLAALPRARLADRGLPPARPPVQQALLAEVARRGRATDEIRDRDRRLRRRHLRAPARADGARVRAARAARRRRDRRRRCARTRS